MPTRVLRSRYRLDEVVDSGATATVWRAMDQQLDRPVAVKILDQAGLGVDHDEALRFRDEARALARLSHPNIVTVFDSGTEDGVAFLVMGLVQGRTVRSRLDGGVLPVAEATAVMAQVCDALTAAHAAGVVHRDIKPGNIVVTPGGTAKLCDFGIARLQGATALTAPNIALGTTSYMAPEQITGQPLDGRADLYAVGCVLFEMLTGKPPFTGESAFSVADQHVHAAPPTVGSQRAGVPSALDSLVGRLLAKDPGRRPAAAAQVRAELMACSDPGTAATVTSPVAWPWRARDRYVRAGLGAAVVVAIPAMAFAAWPRQQANVPAPPAAANDATSAMSSPDTLPGASATMPLTAAIPIPTSATRPGTPTFPTSSAPDQSAPAAAQPPLEQVAALKALVRQLSDNGELGAKEAGDLDRLLNEVASRITQGKTRETQDKIADVRRKNDDLLRAGKITAAGHDAIEARLVRLSEAVASP